MTDENAFGESRVGAGGSKALQMPSRRGYFLLLAQKEVTKEKGLGKNAAALRSQAKKLIKAGRLHLRSFTLFAIFTNHRPSEIRLFFWG